MTVPPIVGPGYAPLSNGAGPDLLALQQQINNITTSVDSATVSRAFFSPFATALGTSAALSVTYSVGAALSLVDGLTLGFRNGSSVSNSSTAPTLAPNGLTAHPITKNGGQALSAGDLAVLGEFFVRYNLANTRWELVGKY